ncbi:hypothetical protein NXX53_20950 [Bacteroides salyersiae]|nr:hypothetical protein [Bacteroides salyersiae]
MYSGSRRDDGSYTRPYIAGFTTAGRFTKPFILPQEETGFYACFLKSFNIPEFMVEPVKFSVREFAGAFQGGCYLRRTGNHFRRQVE